MICSRRIMGNEGVRSFACSRHRQITPPSHNNRPGNANCPETVANCRETSLSLSLSLSLSPGQRRNFPRRNRLRFLILPLKKRAACFTKISRWQPTDPHRNFGEFSIGDSLGPEKIQISSDLVCDRTSNPLCFKGRRPSCS